MNQERFFEYKGVQVLTLSWQTGEWHFCLNGVMYLSYQPWEGAAEERAKAVIDKLTGR